jgi:organic radical activating enzyme
VQYRGLVFDNKDHPEGLATLIVAKGCNNFCPGCCNEYLKNTNIYESSPEELLKVISKYTINKCVVLAGLEWTEQTEDLYNLLDIFQKNGYNVILYTHFSEQELKLKHPHIFDYSIWVKFGDYNIEYNNSNYYSYGIKLATQNQYIKHT